VLGELGCELAQGFFISRPMRSEHVEEWLRSHMSMSGRLAVAGSDIASA
jgi:EAL domain-containing protein (putative c-di-GMP-specific phosphodiesterase class I)